MSDTPRPHVTRALVMCLLAAFLFGASTPVGKRLLDDVSPQTLAGLLYLGAALGVLPAAVRGRAGGDGRHRRGQRARVALTALLGGGVAPVLALMALARAPAASVALWLNLEAVATAALGVAIFGEHLGWRSWSAVGLVVAGGAVLVGADAGVDAAPLVLVALACLCWGADNHLTAVIDGYTPAQVTLAKGAAAGATNLALGLLREPAPSVTAVALALVVGALSHGASVVLYVRGAHALGATRAQLAFATAPFWGAAGAWVALGEPVLGRQLLAAACMAAAVAAFAADHHEHEHDHEPGIHVHEHRHDDGHHDHEHDHEDGGAVHTHEHEHGAVTHAHPHHPDIHHRHHGA